MFLGPLPSLLDQRCCSSNLTAPVPFLSPGRCQTDKQGVGLSPNLPRITVQLGHISYLRCSQWFLTFQESLAWLFCSCSYRFQPCLAAFSAHTGPWRKQSLGQSLSRVLKSDSRPGAEACSSRGPSSETWRFPRSWSSSYRLRAPAGWSLQGVGCPFYKAGKERHGFLLSKQCWTSGSQLKAFTF